MKRKTLLALRVIAVLAGIVFDDLAADDMDGLLW